MEYCSGIGYDKAKNIDEKKLESFLEELALLTKKYKLSISGCGCCGSPWVKEIESEEVVATNVLYAKSVNMYIVN